MLLSSKKSPKQKKRPREKKKSEFEKIYYEYRNLLFYVAKQILNNDSLAEDAVHDTFCRYIEKTPPSQMIKNDQTRNYLVIIVKGLACNMLKYEQTKESVISIEELVLKEDSALSVESVDDLYFEKYDERVLVDAIKSLPEIYYTVLFMKYNHDCSDKEISELLNISPASVRKRVQRAREMLVEILEKPAKDVQRNA